MPQRYLRQVLIFIADPTHKPVQEQRQVESQVATNQMQSAQRHCVARMLAEGKALYVPMGCLSVHVR